MTQAGRRWLLLLAALTVVRSAVFVFWPASHFDSDQAITGLMAKHLAEGRAFPVFWYGQTYMLGVEAWLAAPVMAIAGASVTALKLPLLAMNLAIVVLLMRALTRDAGLPAPSAAFATLFFVLASPITTAHFLTANGGNVEPCLYVLLLWTLRRRAWWMGAVLGIGFLNREFTIYGAVALLLLDAFDRRLFTPVAARRYAIAFGTAAAIWVGFFFLRQVSSAAGPGTSPADLHAQLAGNNLLQVADRLCLDLRAIAAGAGRILTVHWPELFGLESQPLTDFGIESAVRQGLTGSAWLLVPVLGIPAAVLATRSVNRRSHGVRSANRRTWGQVSGAPVFRPGTDVPLYRPDTDAPVYRPGTDVPLYRPGTDVPVSRPGTDGTDGTARDFPRYLMVVAGVSIGGYLAGRCGVVDFYTMRYELLSILGAVGLAARYLQIETGRAARTMWAASCAALFAIAVVGHARLLTEYMTRPPTALKQELVRALEARGTRYAYADYWTAYYVTFMTRERIIVTATEIPRVKTYDRLVNEHRGEAVLISRRACDGGTQVTSAFWICAP